LPNNKNFDAIEIKGMLNNKLCRIAAMTFICLAMVLPGCSPTSPSSGIDPKPGQANKAPEMEVTPMQSQGPVRKVTFIELGSVRCIPCMKMQIIMREIEREYGDQVRIIFYDVWTDAGKPYAQQYRIRVIPTQVFLDRDGNEYFRHEGYFPKEDLIQVLRFKGIK
jgi:thioredoxin 1